MSEANDIQSLFEQVAELSPADRRSFVLNAGYSSDVTTAVLDLLEHYEEESEFLEKPAIETFSALAGTAAGRVAEFRIVRELGRGGMGVVFLAEDMALERRVAVKVLGSHLAGSPAAVARFKREARAAARLSHPSIVPVYRYGEESGVHFIAMEFVEGETLEHRLRNLRSSMIEAAAAPTAGSERRRGRLGSSCVTTASAEYVHECLRITSLVAQGLDAAHQAGVVHCDIKPSNILIDPTGQPRVTDFGIARLGTMDRLTRSGQLAGSLRYMSPEQLACDELDCRTDVYSLGVVLYEMLTLSPPFLGEDLPTIVEAVRNADPKPVTRLNPCVSADLETICQKALEKRPGDRYPTAAHFSADLQCHLRGEPIMARPPVFRRRVRRWMVKRRAWSLAACVVFLLASLSVAGGLQLRHHYQSLASITLDVTPPAPGSSVFVCRWDSSLQAYTDPELVGMLPLMDQYIEPGSVRFVIVSDGAGLAECDAVLRAGESRSLVVSVVDAESAGADMAAFPAGEYVLRPVLWKTVTTDRVFPLAGFQLDRTEVTNQQYKEFVDATGHAAPEHWARFGYDPAMARRPVVGVSRDDAEAYARSRGKRLPTSAEWEAAARSPDGRLYPWGAYPVPSSAALPTYDALVGAQAANFEDQYAEYIGRTVDADVDPAPHGAAAVNHLLGNVMELTSTVMDHDTGSVVIRGGAWVHHPQFVNLRDAHISPRDVPAMNTGFRCARSIDIAVQTIKE